MIKKRLSVVIPAFNEGRTIAPVIKGAKNFSNDIIVVCSKKSNDNTYEKSLAERARVLEDSGKGKGLAMKLGVKKARNGIIVFIDADGSHSPKDIPKLVEPIIRGEADMVIGSRTLGGSEELHGDLDKTLRMIFSLMIDVIVNLRFGSKVLDTQNGFRAIRRKAFEKLNLKSVHTEIETEMCMRCLKNGFRIKEVPSKELKRRFGKSNISLLRHGWRYAWAVIRNLAW